MPELPEVETVARSIAHLVGRRIVSAEFRSLRILRGGDPDRMAAGLAGKRIAGVKRYGKFIVAPLEGGGYLLIHLGMTGRLLLGGPIGKHTHAVLTLDEGVLLFDDSRQFGSFQLSDEFPVRVARLGPEPLEISLDEFTAALKRHKTRVKPLLLNQRFLRGVGNIYADESLFRAKIRPRRSAASLSKEDLRRLYLAVQQVLKEAIKLGGSSVSDYVGADGEEGFFQLKHRVYGREAEKCLVCKTSVKRIVIAGRSAHYCPTCQK